MVRVEMVFVAVAKNAADVRDLQESMMKGYENAKRERAHMDDFGQQEWPEITERYLLQRT